MIDWRANEERKRVFKVHSQYNWIKRRWWWTEKKTIWKRKLEQVHRWRRGGASCVVLGRGLGPQRTLQGMCLWS